jgi:hypothetical protein
MKNKLKEVTIMDKEITRLATEEVINEVEEMGKMELGSDQHVKTAQVVNMVIDRLNKRDEIENERRKLDIEERKTRIEEEKLEHDKKVDWAKVWVGVGTFVIASGIQVWGHLDSKLFEKEGGIYSTEAGKVSNRKILSMLDKFIK